MPQRKGLITLYLILALLFGKGCAGPIASKESRSSRTSNVILFIGDGMGFEQVRAAGMYAHGEAGTLFMETFPCQAEMTTYATGFRITDSAAAGTAMAAGVKVNNGVISMAIPGDGSELKTLLEYFQESGKSAGLVTTTPIFHATPAAFGAHEPDRANKKEIITDYLNRTRPQVLMGGGKPDLTAEAAAKAGYVIVQNKQEMAQLDTENAAMVWGLFAAEIPYEYDGLGELPPLRQMTETALALLDNDPEGFFLMVEGGKIDWAAHDNDIVRTVTETVALDVAVMAAYDWAQGRNDTLIVVTADHETGGMKIMKNNGPGLAPDVFWGTTGHTAAPVPVYAWGTGAQLFAGRMDNTDIFYKIMTAANIAIEVPSK